MNNNNNNNNNNNKEILKIFNNFITIVARIMKISGYIGSANAYHCTKFQKDTMIINDASEV